MSTAHRRWFASWIRPNRQQRRAQRAPTSFRPNLEKLEDRTVPASPKTFQIGSTDAGFLAAIDEFRAGLGGVELTQAGQAANPTGRREITWNDVTVNPLSNFDGNYFNTNPDPRGLVLSMLTGQSPTDKSNFSVSPDRFQSINQSYDTTFSELVPGERLFSPITTNTVRVSFTDPSGAHPPATTKGFGLVFSDVDFDDSTSITVFYRDVVGAALKQTTLFAPAANGGHSFVGITFTNGERIDHVDVTTGNRPLSALNTEGANDPTVDVVAIANVIYAQPQNESRRFFLRLDSDGAWNDATKWVQTSGDQGNSLGYPGRSGDVAIFGDNLTAPRTVTVTANLNINVGSIQIDTNQNLTIDHDTQNAPNAKIIFQSIGSPNNNSATTVALDVSHFNGANTTTFGLPIQLNQNLEITNLDPGSVVRFSDAVSEGFNNRTITQRGAGLIGFSGASSTFGGNYSALGGTTNLANNADLNDSRVSLTGGTLTGSGEVDGITGNVSAGVINTISPGQPGASGTINSTNTVLLGSNSRVVIKLRGLNDFDRLTSTQDITLGANNNPILSSTLVLDLSEYGDPAGPQPNDTFKIVEGLGQNADVNGRFAQGTVISAGNKLFRIDYNSHDVTLTCVDAATTVSLTRSPDSDSFFGQTRTFTALVEAQAGVPQGFVRFSYLDSNGNAIVPGDDVTVGQSGPTASSATTPAKSLPSGIYTVTAVFHPDPNTLHLGNDNNPATLTHIVNKANVTVTVSANPTTVVFGNSVVTAHVQATNGQGVGIPGSGTVQFFHTVNNQDVNLGLPVPINGSGNATLSVLLDVGVYDIKATFASSDGNFNGGSDLTPLTYTVNAANTQTALTSNPATWVFNTNIEFKATVSAPTANGQVPTGMVEFFNPLGTSLGSFPLVDGEAKVTAKLGANQQTVRAVYTPDTANFNGSQDTESQTVQPAPVTITVAATPATVFFGEGYVLSTTVAAGNPGGPTPDGNVVFTLSSGGNTFNSNPVALDNNGQASLNSSELPNLPVGNYSVTAAYQGSNQYEPDSATVNNGLVVNKANTTLALTPQIAITGALVQMTATLSVDSPGAGTPNGNVHFVVALNGTPVMQQDASVQHNQTQHFAIFSTNTLVPGNYTVTATYEGNSSFNPSAPVQAALTINKANTTITLDPNPSSQFAEPKTFTAHITSEIPNSGVQVGGFAEFQLVRVINGLPVQPPVEIVTVAVNDGLATYNAPLKQAVGEYLVSARYLDNLVFNASGPTLPIQHVIGSANSVVQVQVVLQNPQGTPTFGQQLTFRATVAAANPNAGIPNGTVIFTLVLPDGSPNIVSPPVVLSATGTADFSPVQVLPPTEGRSPIKVFVAYNGDDSEQRFLPSSNTLNPLLQTVLRANTSTALAITRLSDNAVTGIQYGDAVRLKATVSTLGLDPIASARAGKPQGKVQFVYLMNNVEVNLGAPVALNANGEATLDAFGGQQVRVPVGTQTFRAKYVDDRGYAIFNPSQAQSSTTVQPHEVIAELLTVKPATGSSSKTNTYAYGRSLVFTIRYRFTTPVAAGTLIDGSAAQTVPTGTGQFQFVSTTGVTFTTPVLNLAPAVQTLLAGKAAITAQPFSTMTFKSSPLFNTSIANRTAGTNKNLIIPSGKYNVTMNFTSNTPNALSFGFNKIVLNLAFTVQNASVGRRW